MQPTLFFAGLLLSAFIPVSSGAILDSSIWTVSSCSGNPGFITRVDSPSVTDCSSYSAAGCSALTDSGSAKYTCPASMTAGFASITTPAKYLVADVYTAAECSGAVGTRLAFLADNGCRQSGTQYIKAECGTSSGTVTTCTDSACTQGCTTAYTATSFDTCTSSLYKLSCSTIGASTMVQASWIAVALSVVVSGMLAL